VPSLTAWRVFSAPLIPTLFALSLLFYAPPTSAVLVALAPGEKTAPLLERVLVTFDPLSESQTVVAQTSLRGALKHFAVLTAVPKGVEISYTTTAIWNHLNRYVGPKVIYERSLDLQPYSYLWGLIVDDSNERSVSLETYGVWRSNHTGVYATEAALHEWLISQGLTLSASHALSVKDIYASGLAVAVIEVKPKRPDVHAHETTWTSTWIFTSPSASPHYWVARPRLPRPLSEAPSPLEARYPLNLTTLTEWPTQLAQPSGLSSRSRLSSSRLEGAQHAVSEAEALSETRMTAYAKVSREHVSRFNKKLQSTRWNFRRGGTLTQLETQPREGVWRVALERSSEDPQVERILQTRKRRYTLPLPIEPLLALLYGLWWLWFRYAQEEP